ncbi:hypothetical protein D3C73_994600 [compost metagenome]
MGGLTASRYGGAQVGAKNRSADLVLVTVENRLQVCWEGTVLLCYIHWNRHYDNAVPVRVQKLAGLTHRICIHEWARERVCRLWFCHFLEFGLVVVLQLLDEFSHSLLDCGHVCRIADKRRRAGPTLGVLDEVSEGARAKFDDDKRILVSRYSSAHRLRALDRCAELPTTTGELEREGGLAQRAWRNRRQTPGDDEYLFLQEGSLQLRGDGGIRTETQRDAPILPASKFDF